MANHSQTVQIGAPTGEQCWSCGDMRAAAFCTSCGRVQPPAPTDFFSFFGLQRKLNIEPKALEQAFYQMSRKLHPDVYANATSKEQGWSLQQSSLLNDAYRTLKDPIARTEYLLKLEGVEFEGQSKAATDQARESGTQKKQVVPPELLEEVFELNMQLEEARMNKKMGEVDEALSNELEETKKNLQAKYDGLMDELKSYWNEWDAIEDRAADDQERRAVRDKMVDLLNRRSYIRNLVRDVNEVLET